MINLKIKTGKPKFKDKKINDFVEKIIKEVELVNFGEHTKISYSDGLFAILQNSDFFKKNAENFESHKKFIDIHYVVSGNEIFNYFSLMNSDVTTYKESLLDDYYLYDNSKCNFNEIVLSENEYIVFDFDIAHRSNVCCVGDSTRHKKVVFKISHEIFVEEFLYVE